MESSLLETFQTLVVRNRFFYHRCGFCYLEVENILAGVYNIIPTTFLPQQEGPFFLDFDLNCRKNCSKLRSSSLSEYSTLACSQAC